MKAFNLKLVVPFAVIAFMAAFDPAQIALAASIPISDQPLFTQSSQPPLMMMVMSRDEQLYNKAFSDYSNLRKGEAGDTGRLSTTYDDTFDYSGYFGSNLCYGYSNSVFSVSKAANGTNKHSCGGQWSGNFLNWVTMSRLDEVRYVLYGGLRSTDDATATTSRTVLERAAIPNDLHAWVKIYSGSDIGSFTPYTTPTSFCNASFAGNANPYMRVANGAWTEWSSTAGAQCNWGSGDNPASGTDFVVRVDVCDSSNSALLEPFCRPYQRSGGVVKYKPAGLLQEYGEDGKIRFGLMTGSYAQPRSGGRLRRNIGVLAGNSGPQTDGCASGDEVNLSTGKFCNQSSGTEGIINTLNQFRLVGWSGTSWSGGVTGAAYNDKCEQWGGRSRKNNDGEWVLDNPGGGDRHCSAWGNPLSELYAEALRYIEGDGNTPTSGFIKESDKSYLPNIPDQISWKDPYAPVSTSGLGNPYCAKCNILVLSTGLNTFDSDEIPSDSHGIDAKAATTELGGIEGINGGNYLIGRVLGQSGSPASLAIGSSVSTSSDTCTGKTVDALGNAIGLCPDVPATEGSYYVSGLAYKAWTLDLRPDLADSSATGKPATYKNTVKTFGVALAESLPNFSIPVGGKTIDFSPLCQSNRSGTADFGTANWASCRLSASINVGTKVASVAPKYTYGRDLAYDSTAKGYTAGSYSFVWEDSPFGSDNDLDVTQVVTWCVGKACQYQSPQTSSGTRKNTDGTKFSGYDICWRSQSTICGGGNNGKPAVGDNEVLIRTEITSTAGGYAMASGYNIAGTAAADGAKKTDRATKCNNANGNADGSSGMGDFSVLSKTENPPKCWTLPDVQKFTAGSSSTKRLENPLFYAAKYGSFNDLNSNGKPDPGEWDSETSGTPDNFFAVTNPAKLKAELRKIFNQTLVDAAPTASTATSTPRFVPGGTLAYQVSYNAKDWTGDVEAFNLNSNGTLGASVWKAKNLLPAPAGRKIFTSKRVASGAATKFAGTPFTVAGLNVPVVPGVPAPTLQTTLMGSLTAPFVLADVMAYLRGDQSKEQSTTPPGPYRTRSSTIGDILNSTPAVQGKTTFGYGRLPEKIAGVATGKADYQAFVQTKGTIPTVYVGSNDGMLHAIDGNPIKPPTSTGGVEKFAYVPNAVLGKLNRLTQPSYAGAHTYFVDGSPLIGDAFNGSAWQTVLLGSTGAGASAVFALNITAPDTFAESSVMWEFNNQLDADMGQALVQPALGLTEDGSWRVAFGNGLNSASNRAILYVRDLWSGGEIAKIDTTIGSADAPNGLATATIVDTDGNGAGDTIYAGDYQGNMWKFIYDASSAMKWVIANGGSPIFKAIDKNGKAQSITSGVYTIANPLGGTMVLFGTGRYLSPADSDPLNPPAVDTIYSIWDADVPSGSPCTVARPAAPVRSQLQEQTITGDSAGYISSTQNAFDFMCTSASGKMGWYMDLTYTTGGKDLLAGNRVLAAPTVILGTLLANTFQPMGDICVPGGSNFLMELDALSGAANYSEIGGTGIPTPGAGSGTGGTLIGTGPPQGSPLPVVAIPVPPVVPPINCVPGSEGCDPILGTSGSTECKWTLPNPANKSIQTPIPCGRVSWRQLR